MLRRHFLAACSTLPALAAAPPKRLLWTGSSSMYYHNMPQLVADWCNRFGSMNFRSEIVGRSGDGIHVYLKPGSFKPEYGFRQGQTFLEKLAAERYDHVVLQAVARFSVGPSGDEHIAALHTYCKAIREAGGEPVFYEMGWGSDDQPGRDRILDAARQEKIRLYVPCSSAWDRVRRQRPELELQNLPDRSHPGTLGHYLNVCCFYAAFTGRDPKVLPTEYPVWLALDDAQKAESERIAAGRPPGDPYFDALPAFLKRRAVMAQTHRLDPRIARYFQTVAWETWREFHTKLS